MNIPTLPDPDGNNPPLPSPPRAAPRGALRLGSGLLLAALLLSGSTTRQLRAGTPPDDASAPRVIATFYPLYLIAANVVDGLSPAPSLLLEPAGGCAHGLSLRPSQVATLGRADLIVETGLGLEPFLESDRLPWREGVLRVPLARDIPESELIALLDEHDHGHDHYEHGHENVAPGEQDHDEHGHDQRGHEAHGAHDPDTDPRPGGRDGFNGHAWSSPRLAAQMTRTLAEALAAHDPARADLYRPNASDYAARLDALADELAAAAAPLRGARVALSHTSLAYLARDLNLNVVAVLRDEDENEPGPRGLTRLIDAARADGLDAVLYDPQDQGRLAGLFAGETGCERVIKLDPAASGPLEPDAYLEIMNANLAAIRAWAEDVQLARLDRPPPRNRIASSQHHDTESSSP